MESLWERWVEPRCMRAARWLACPERPVEPVDGLPSVAELFSAFAVFTVDDADKTKEALDFCQWLFDRQEERTKTLESKASTLMGFAGITTAFVSGFAALLLDAKNIPCTLLGLLVVVYLLLVYSFVRTILCALVVVTVGPRYRFKYPASRDILGLKDNSVPKLHGQRAVDFFDSYANNRAINDDKAGYLISAQRSFAIATLLVFVVTIVFGGYLSYTLLSPWLSAGVR